jgi:hypothetical protein
VAAAAADAEPGWLDAVVATLTADATTEGRSGLVVKAGQGVWLHATFTDNRASIFDHGLDWRWFAGSGIAGTDAPETGGIFLCADMESAEWFGRMGRHRGRETDLWAVALDGEWLISDPSHSGGLDDGMMICRTPIPATRLKLLRAG